MTIFLVKFLKKIPLIKTEDSASDLKFQDHADSNNKINEAKTLKSGILRKAKLSNNEGFIFAAADDSSHSNGRRRSKRLKKVKFAEQTKVVMQRRKNVTS